MTRTRSLSEYLHTPDAPWVSRLLVPEGWTANDLPALPPGFVLRVIDGTQCGTPAALFAELARAWDFPDYFGHNWDALEECLEDLEWLPAHGYVLLITNAQAVIPDDEDKCLTLVEVLDAAGQTWSLLQEGNSRGPIPFHTIFAVRGTPRATHPVWGLEPTPWGG